MIFNLILNILFVQIVSISDFEPTGDDAFDFYFLEFTENHLDAGHKMLDLIEDGLVEAIFSTTDTAKFENYIHLLKEAALRQPEKYLQYHSLDERLEDELSKRIRAAKSKRWIYGAAGLAIGAIVGIPIGKAISSSSKILWLSIPAGALAGGGAGYLLADILHTPDYTYKAGSLTSDLDRYREEIFGGDE